MTVRSKSERQSDNGGTEQQVGSALYEAAGVDSTNSVQEPIHVSIQGIRQTIAFALIMTIMWYL